MAGLLRRNDTGVGTVCLFVDPARQQDAVALRALMAVEVIVAVTVILVNAFTIAAIWPRRWRRSTQSSLFVLHLAFADFLCGLAKLVIFVFMSDCAAAELASVHETACLGPVIFICFAWTLSATTLAAIAVDRYVCIVHSLRYYEFLTTRRVCVILASLWGFSALCGLLYLPTWEWQEGRFCEEQNLFPEWHLYAVQIPISMLVLLVVAATHIAIRSEVKRNNARCWTAGHAGLRLPSSKSASVRSAKVTVLVVSSFIMGYLPLAVFQVLLHSAFQDHVAVAHWDFHVVSVSSSLWYLLNPFIYAWKNASIRQDMVTLWRRLVGGALCCSSFRTEDETSFAGSRTSPTEARRF
ncbi:hypothetical protein ONE63_005354 [Megalurothrips usitatus]|uniref:G-protein coupled receptors family 1 profile domain-containing protein n=1 Tax=Megalurothrips usitatus TaxID=439358 RepID=A0AAV7Y030_9NEOP|nr:hypothetical protein ONE63_005354 [Megalurothrips usitatus]